MESGRRDDAPDRSCVPSDSGRAQDLRCRSPLRARRATPGFPSHRDRWRPGPEFGRVELTWCVSCWVPRRDLASLPAADLKIIARATTWLLAVAMPAKRRAEQGTAMVWPF